MSFEIESGRDSTEVAIDAKSLSKYFRMHAANSRALVRQLFGKTPENEAFQALKEVTFQVHKGETFGIVGRNGSGKSTLLQIIAGTLQPSSGTVAVRGRVAALLELGSGFNPEFTGRENVFLNAAILGLSRQQTDARLQDILDFADIGEFIDQPVKNYSSGMTVRLAFSVIAHVDADILIIDEALSVGDAFFSQKCMRFLRDFQKRGTLLFVSHDAAAVTNLCDRAIWLTQGEVVAHGPAREVVETYMAHQHVQQAKEIGVGGVAVTSPPRLSSAGWVRSDAGKMDRPKGVRYEVFELDPERFGVEFGEGGATIESVEFLDEAGATATIVEGEVTARLRISVRAKRDLENLIVGFYLKDRLGQRLFGENTYETYKGNPLSSLAGQLVIAEFKFRIPTMPSGSYMFDVAVATGTQAEHVHQHWVHDALEFRTLDESMRYGLMRIPMDEISFFVDGRTL